MSNLMNDVVLATLWLTLNVIHTVIVDFDQVNVY